MDTRRLDTVAKLFADRRLSRRKALEQGGAGLAAGALAAAGFSAITSAQDATPASEEDAGESGESPAMLFVQTYQSGAITPKDGEPDRYTLTLEQGHGQTIYFSDRPDRIVGATTTPQFLEGLGFPDDNPPNAALIVETAPGETDVAVIELFSPVYDEATQGVTYEIEVLENWQAELEMEFHEAPTDLATIEPSFGSAHLFIDGIADCPDADLICSTGGGQQVGTIPNADHDGFCINRPQLICYPCKGPDAGGSWADECNRRFSDCNGNCTYSPTCTGVFGC